MIKTIILIAILALIPLIVAHSLPSIYSNYNSPIVINSITIYKNLQYKIELQKQVTQNVTVTTTTNTTTTTTVTHTEIPKTVGIYIVNYTVINISNQNIYVEISGNFTKNFTFIRQGNYSINILQDVISLNYPYIPPFLLLNSTYALFVKSTPYVISYIRSANYTILGRNIVAYEFEVGYNSSYFVTYELLSNGLLANFSTWYNGSTVIMSLINYGGEYNITFNSTLDLNYVSKPYLYLEYVYSPVADSLQPQNYVQVYYPFIVGNYVGQIVYLLYPQQGKLLVPNIFYATYVNFELYFMPAKDLVLTYLQTNSSNIVWNDKYFDFVNVTQLQLINGSVANALLYRNVTQNSTIYLYFSQDSHILLEELVYNMTSHQYTIGLEFLGNDYYSPNLTYPNLTSPEYTTLNYSLVNFNEGLIIAIVITVVLSIIIILFRER